jgi:hypothetical protein
LRRLELTHIPLFLREGVSAKPGEHVEASINHRPILGAYNVLWFLLVKAAKTSDWLVALDRVAAIRAELWSLDDLHRSSETFTQQRESRFSTRSSDLRPTNT